MGRCAASAALGALSGVVAAASGVRRVGEGRRRKEGEKGRGKREKGKGKTAADAFSLGFILRRAIWKGWHMAVHPLQTSEAGFRSRQRHVILSGWLYLA